MLPLILGVLGGYLIGDSIKDGAISMAKGGLTPTENLVKELHKLQRELNGRRLRLQDYIADDNSDEVIAIEKEREFKLARFNEVLELLRKSDTKLADGGEISKSWGVMLFKESKNRFGERIESAFNNLIMKGTLKQVIEEVKEELVGNVIYGTIKDRAGDVLVAKVKQDGTINIYREGYGIDKMAKGGITDDGGIEFDGKYQKNLEELLKNEGINISFYNEAIDDVPKEKATKIGLSSWEPYLSVILRPIKKTTFDWVMNKINSDKVFKSFAETFNKLLKEKGFEGINAYPTTYGIGTFVGFGVSIEESKKGVAKALDELGINYTTEYSDSQYVFRYKISKSKENIDKINSIVRKFDKGGKLGNVKAYPELVGKFDYWEIKHKDSENNISYSYEKKNIGSPNPFNGTEISKEEYERATNNMAKGGKVSDVYIFDIYLYSYDDEGLSDVKEKRKMSVKASSRAKAYDKVQTKYPKPYFVELNRMGRD